MTTSSLKSLIAPAFYDIHRNIKNGDFTHYWLKGGRASTKSSFISLEVALDIIKDKNANAAILRKFGTSIDKSVYNQMVWALDKLQISEFFRFYKSPPRIEFIPTGQEILFIGLDDPQKIKSIKPKNGYFKDIWFEEITEFDGVEEIRNALQSLMRGGNKFNVFYSFNPPAEPNNWANKEANKQNDNKILHHSTYLDVPKEWLGEAFLIEAELLKNENPLVYAHEYMGEAVGLGLSVFNNIKIQKIEKLEINKFDNIIEGIDWGFSVDPFVFIKAHYSAKYRTLYIFDEIYKIGISNEDAINLVENKHCAYSEIIADSAEPKSIYDFDNAGLPIRAAKKGAGSVQYGIKRLQGLRQIIIDPVRCPNAAREFQEYSYIKNKDGTTKSAYPDKNNHTIDAVRYALEDEFEN